jgi:hypothetical protein
MGESPDKDAGDDKKIESASIENQLPIVWSPKLEAAGETAEGPAHSEPPPDDDDVIDATAHEAAAAAAPVRSSRFVLLAASITLAAAFGSFVGSLSAPGFAHLWPATETRPNATEASTLPVIKAELAELAALKANLDSAIHNTSSQFAKIADRLDHVEHAQIDPATKIAHIADTVDRLDKRSAAAPETTGTIAAGQPPAAEPKLPDRILADWIVRGVRGGRALVFNRYGGVFDVASGNILPGLGRVETIKREDGEWIVVTARGVITSGR